MDVIFFCCSLAWPFTWIIWQDGQTIFMWQRVQTNPSWVTVSFKPLFTVTNFFSSLENSFMDSEIIYFKIFYFAKWAYRGVKDSDGSLCCTGFCTSGVEFFWSIHLTGRLCSSFWSHGKGGRARGILAWPCDSCNSGSWVPEATAGQKADAYPWRNYWEDVSSLCIRAQGLGIKELGFADLLGDTEPLGSIFCVLGALLATFGCFVLYSCLISLFSECSVAGGMELEGCVRAE